jgi:hypothetical protein
MTDWEITDIHSGEISSGVPGWIIYLQRPDGSSWATVIPKVAIDWRAAEYGLQDLDTIFDILLHEGHADDISQKAQEKPPMVSLRTGQPIVSKKAKIPDEPLPSLYEATSTTEARNAHLERIARVKESKVRMVDPQGLLEQVKTDHQWDSDSVGAKREHVDINRWTSLYGQLPIPPEDVEKGPIDVDTFFEMSKKIE